MNDCKGGVTASERAVPLISQDHDAVINKTVRPRLSDCLCPRRVPRWYLVTGDDVRIPDLQQCPSRRGELYLEEELFMSD